MTDAVASKARASCRLLLVGVGGQGAVSAARWLGEAALGAGLDVRVGQLHGMSQRGGNVEASVSIGPGESGFVADGAADLVVALEPLELLRARPRMGAHTRALVSTARIVPLPLALRGGTYPPLSELLAATRRVVAEVIPIDAAALAEQAGSVRAVNVVMLGALAATNALPFAAALLADTIARLGPARLGQIVRRAFALGQAALDARVREG